MKLNLFLLLCCLLLPCLADKLCEGPSCVQCTAGSPYCAWLPDSERCIFLNETVVPGFPPQKKSPIVEPKCPQKAALGMLSAAGVGAVGWHVFAIVAGLALTVVSLVLTILTKPFFWCGRCCRREGTCSRCHHRHHQGGCVDRVGQDVYETQTVNRTRRIPFQNSRQVDRVRREPRYRNVKTTVLVTKEYPDGRTQTSNMEIDGVVGVVPELVGYEDVHYTETEYFQDHREQHYTEQVQVAVQQSHQCGCGSCACSRCEFKKSEDRCCTGVWVFGRYGWLLAREGSIWGILLIPFLVCSAVAFMIAVVGPNWYFTYQGTKSLAYIGFYVGGGLLFLMVITLALSLFYCRGCWCFRWSHWARRRGHDDDDLDFLLSPRRRSLYTAL